MPDINSYYGGGGVNVDTKAPGTSFTPNNGNLSGMLNDSLMWKKAMAEREMRMREQQAGDQAAQAKNQRKQVGIDRERQLQADIRANTDRLQEQMSHGGDARRQMLQDQFNESKMNDEMAQMKAKQGLAPMKQVTGFNMIGSANGRDTLDPGMMNAYQRQAFLPGGSSMSGGGSSGAGGGGGQSSGGVPSYGTGGGQPAYAGGGAEGPGAQFANIQMLEALKRSNAGYGR